MIIDWLFNKMPQHYEIPEKLLILATVLHVY